MDDVEAVARRVREAAGAISGEVHRTPLLSSRSLGERIGAPAHLKAENLQKTGSFKVRGALTRLLSLEEGARGKGVVTVSAGNHAQALAWAARAAGVPCTVVMPDRASETKVAASRSYGAEVVLHGDVFEAFERARSLEREEGFFFVHPFDDPEIIAGQGTAGAEILEDLPDATDIIVPVGGGGLISGVAAACHAAGGNVRVVGVEPEGASSMHRSLTEGRPVRLDRVDTIADGLGAPMAGEWTYRIVRRWVQEVVLVTDEEIRRAMTFLLERAKLLTEPAGAAAVAALLAGRIRIRPAARVVAVLSGGNVAAKVLPDLLLDADSAG